MLRLKSALGSPIYSCFHSSVWSGLMCSFCGIEHILFEYLTVYFLLTTSFESLSRHSFTLSQVLVCYLFDILSQSGYNLTMLHFFRVYVLFADSSLTKVIPMKVYKVHCRTVFLVNSSPADNLLIQKDINLLNCWSIQSIRQFESCPVWRQ